MAAALALTVAVGAPAAPGTGNEFDGVAVVTQGSSLGTGFFIEPHLLLTAEHVVSESSEVWLEIGTSRSRGSVVSVDAELDLALVRTEADAPVVLELDQGRAEIGDEVFAVGAAEGNLSMTRGIVSGYRTLDGQEYLQTDAAVNPGNSGGPLLDHDGDAVGVVVTRLSDAEGIGLAVRATTAAAFVARAPTPPTADPSSEATSQGRRQTWWMWSLAAVLVAAAAAATLVTTRRRRPSKSTLVITRDDLELSPVTHDPKGPQRVND